MTTAIVNYDIYSTIRVQYTMGLYVYTVEDFSILFRYDCQHDYECRSAAFYQWPACYSCYHVIL